MINYKEKLHKIKAFVFDYDGVISDGFIWMLDDKQAVRCANVKDGYALQYAIKKGYIVAVISGATSTSINNRMSQLGVTQVHTGCANKMDTYQQFLKANSLQPDEVAVMGDDIPDYHILQHCGVSACPADAATEIKEIVDDISIFGGGQGCVRDIIEQTLRLQGQWFHADAVNW